MVSTPGRLHISQMLKALAASPAVTSPSHDLPKVAFQELQRLCKPVLILAVENSSTCVHRNFANLYPISRSGTNLKVPP